MATDTSFSKVVPVLPQYTISREAQEIMSPEELKTAKGWCVAQLKSALKRKRHDG